MLARGFPVSILAILAANSAFATEVSTPPGWNEASREKGIVIFSQDDAKLNGKAFKAVGDADATPEQVFRVVTDVESHSKFMPFTKESRILKRINENEVIAYQVIEPPMISKRDFHLHITLTPGTNGVWKSEWTNLPNYEPERSGYVRMPVAEGSWAFEPLDGGKRTRITYTSLTKIGGWIPSGIADMSSLRVIPDMFAALRKRIGEVLKTPPSQSMPQVTASK